MNDARRAVFVTGGSRGIGAACAHALAASGQWGRIVVGWHRRGEAAEALRRELQRRHPGVDVRALQLDVGDADSVRTAFDALRGQGALHGVVHSAGIVAPAARLDAMDDARLERVARVNVVGSWRVAREAVRMMSTAHGGAGGSLVLLGSVAARLGSPAMYVDYASSKGAVDTLAVGLAREVAAEGVRVNVVRPGIIDTEIHADSGDPDRARTMAASLPMGRAGRADEVAAAVVWLLGDGASYTTGAVLDVGGGR